MVISRWAATFGSKRSNLSSPNQGLLAALLLTCAKTPEHGAKPIAWSGVASVGHLRVLRLVYSLVQKWLEISVHLEKSHNSYRSLLVFPKRQTQNSREQIFNRSFSVGDHTTTQETCAVAKAMTSGITSLGMRRAFPETRVQLWGHCGGNKWNIL